jgi:hypothetical protein
VLGDMEIKDWLLICTSIAAVASVFWKALFGGEKELRTWAEKEFVRREVFDLHLQDVKDEIAGFRAQIADQHRDNHNLLMEIIRSVGGKVPPQPVQPSYRRERPSDPGRR